MASAAIEAFKIIEENNILKTTLEKNTLYFRSKMLSNGFDILEGTHPIVPIMLYNAKKAKKMSSKLLEEGIYAIGFHYPVVPKDRARIRVQISSTMKKQHLDKSIEAFKKVGSQLGII